MILLLAGAGRAFCVVAARSAEGGVPQFAAHGCTFSSTAASSLVPEHSKSCCTANCCTAAAAARAARSVIASALSSAATATPAGLAPLPGPQRKRRRLVGSDGAACGVASCGVAAVGLGPTPKRKSRRLPGASCGVGSG